MFDRTKLSVAVCQRHYGQSPQCYVVVYYTGNPIYVSDDYEPGPDLLEIMDKVEIFVRHAQDGAKWELAFLTAFPS